MKLNVFLGHDHQAPRILFAYQVGGGVISWDFEFGMVLPQLSLSNRHNVGFCFFYAKLGS